MTFAVEEAVVSSRLAQSLSRAEAERTALRAVGAASALSARVAVEAGFDALWVSGLEVSTSLGLPDENVLGPRDLADVVSVLGRSAAGLPVIVDIDNAGGSVATAHRFGADLTAAGAAALCLEDSTYPKVNSFAEHRHQQLAETALVVDQLAALREATATQTLLIARTEMLICGGTLPEALERAHTYTEAGADAVLVHSKDRSGAQALETAAAWNGRVPLVTVPTAFPHHGPQELGEAGFSLVIYANQFTRAALAAMTAAAAHFAATGSFSAPGGPPLADVQTLLRIGNPSARSCL
ncbi:isocitrate lyase/phosphoenolpyruvate mutase family protein [Streptomyces sp. NPDC048637]|uniref:isocitrate lyase/phosphoenolpyruvate mutase family protein n=1 Tax=Streptomyces sp. NPDC048637 TaxID=3155636 RepID=UPI003433A728